MSVIVVGDFLSRNSNASINLIIPFVTQFNLHSFQPRPDIRGLLDIRLTFSAASWPR
jgi:hypothetical protein